MGDRAGYGGSGFLGTSSENLDAIYTLGVLEDLCEWWRTSTTWGKKTDEGRRACAMCRIIEVSDIVHLICILAKPADLATLARTSTSLFVAAVEELYEHSDYHQLLHLLRVCGEHRKEPPTTEGSERSRNTARAAARFDHYAPFIRHLSLSGAWWMAIPEGHNGFDTDVEHLSNLLSKFAAIAPASGFTPLLPNLRTFKLDPEYGGQIEHIMPLFSAELPYLESFSIQLGNATHKADLASMLGHLPHTAPNLRRISLPGGLSDSQDLASSFARLIGKLPSLESFEGGPASFGAGVLQNLDHCSHLGTLILRGGNYEDDVVSSACLGHGPVCERHLRALRRLELRARPTRLTNYILERMDPDQLQALTIWLSGQDGLSLAEDVQRPIAAVVRFPEIEALDLRFHGELKEEDAPQFWPNVSALFACRRLRTLFLFVSIPLKRGVDDEIVESMARAWPELREFALMWNDDDNPPGPTLQSLVALTTNCRQLDTIQLQTLRAPAGQVRKVDASSNKTRPLHLRVRKYNLDDTDEAASFLVNVTSCLTVARISVFSRAYFWLDEFDEDGIWNDVVSRMRTIRSLGPDGYLRRQAGSRQAIDRYLGIVDVR
ncbi:hypothetical protein CALVIDRAFT_556192 [Calocera viscosa TUFC12733]|uniref:F-box domain-containing protein n=1 Tax=Calocera viscosa (strain TUFC12733) TaxID=1330018 RepID=A0A167KIP5_CALVF|nr:hypothetical protein CALVIDRAFT_556192 [Calocera viscosa TUFC12733]